MSLTFDLKNFNYDDVQMFYYFLNDAAETHSLLLNYICKDETKCKVVITGPMLAPSMSLAQVLHLYKYPQWDVTTSKRDYTFDSFHGTLAFAHHHAEISGFKNYVHIFNPSNYTDISLAGLCWMYFSCEASTSNCKTLENCSSNVSLEWLMLQSSDIAFSDNGYDVYNAVYAIAHAFHEMLLQQLENQLINTRKALDSGCLELHLFLKNMHFINPVGDAIHMNQKEKLQAEYDIYHIWSFPHDVGLKVKIGEFSPYFLHGQQLHLSQDMIEWATGSRQIPSAVCSIDCYPGYRKVHQEGMAACCFDCIPCPENEISNE
ncbi:hypothetical protein A6R68_11887, partial [Neotoma lepida]